MEDRLHLLGIRHHGPGSAALLRQALDALDPECVLIEGPPEADEMVRYVAGEGIIPPVALLLHASAADADASAAAFVPFAEFSPEWQAMLWALPRNRSVRFIDWPSAISLAAPRQDRDPSVPSQDPLDLMAEAAGHSDGEAFWNALIEQNSAQYGAATQVEGPGKHALAVFAAIERAMTEARAHHKQQSQPDQSEALREARREAFMRINIRHALKSHEGPIAVVCGAWHLSALRSTATLAADKATVKDLPKVKVDVTWVPWTDSRLSARSGYGAGIVSPGWYRHLWSLYSANSEPVAPAQPRRPDRSDSPIDPPDSDPDSAPDSAPDIAHFAALWQSKTASLLRAQGHDAPTASAIEASRLALSLAAMRGLGAPGLGEMRDAALATLCHGDAIAMLLIEQKLYIGERVGEIGEGVPQMPLARDLAAWQKKTRLKPEDVDTDLRLDLRTEAGLLKSTLLHRLTLIEVPWGKLVDAEAGRGTFREIWHLRWLPELSIALAEALVYGITIEQAAGNRTLARAKDGPSITALADLVRAALVAGLLDAATACIQHLQAAAVRASDVTDLMQAVVPLVRVLRYGTARKLPEEALRALVLSISVEINAGVRTGSHALDKDSSTLRVQAMAAYNEALGLFADIALTSDWNAQLARMVDDDQVAPAVAGLALRQLHDSRTWELQPVAAAFSRHMGGRAPQLAGDFLEGFLSGGSEVVLQDRPLLQLVDIWICGLREEDFIASLPLLRRSLSGFDSVSRRRLMEAIKQGPSESFEAVPVHAEEDNPAFQAALPLLFQILGIATGNGGPQ